MSQHQNKVRYLHKTCAQELTFQKRLFSTSPLPSAKQKSRTDLDRQGSWYLRRLKQNARKAHAWSVSQIPNTLRLRWCMRVQGVLSQWAIARVDRPRCCAVFAVWFFHETFFAERTCGDKFIHNHADPWLMLDRGVGYGSLTVFFFATGSTSKSIRAFVPEFCTQQIR